MHAGRRHQVAQVVHLKIIPVLERHGVGIAVALPDQHRRVEVAVGALGPGDYVDGPFDVPAEILVPGNGIGCDGGLHELVEIAVVERCAPVAALGQAGGDFEVAEVLGIIGTLHQPPHAREHPGVAKLEPIGPEAGGPMGLAQGQRFDPGVRAQVCFGSACCLTNQSSNREQGGKSSVYLDNPKGIAASSPGLRVPRRSTAKAGGTSYLGYAWQRFTSLKGLHNIAPKH